MANNKISLFFKSLLLGIFISGFGVNGHAANLPAGYTELEYIESTGTQWINPSVSYTENDSLRLVMDMQYTDTNLSSAQLSGIFASAYMGIAAGNIGAAGTWSVAGGVTNANADTLRHTFDMSATIDSDQIVTLKIDNNTYTHTRNVGSGNLGILNLVSGSGNFYSKAKLYSTKVYKNVTLVRDMIPAKNSSNVIGMYDLVSGQFFTNAGTGTFTAGPVVDSCRNLFDMQIEQGNIGNDGANTSSSARVRTAGYISVSPNTTYTLSVDIDDYTGSSSGGVFLRFYNASSGDFAEHYLTSDGWHDPRGGYTFTTPAGAYGLRIIFAKGSTSTTITPSEISNIQLELGSTATEYVPFCANAIKIATTAYNSARFSPVVTELNDTIATIRDVVTNTINQTKAIADLQATKQTRPNENCPAGKKCLLVEDDAGQPHWYEIIENAYGLPNGYTALEYIQSTGTQYIDTGITGSTNAIIDMQGTPRTDEMIVFMLAPIDATVYQNGFGQYQSTMAGFDIATRRVYNVSYTSNSMTVNGVNVSNRYIANNVNLALFGSTASNRKIKDAKLYSAKIYNNDTLLRNFVPAKRNSDNVIGMYDTVSGTFFTNAGTGTFVDGPEI